MLISFLNDLGRFNLKYGLGKCSLSSMSFLRKYVFAKPLYMTSVNYI